MLQDVLQGNCHLVPHFLKGEKLTAGIEEDSKMGLNEIQTPSNPSDYY